MAGSQAQIPSGTKVQFTSGNTTPPSNDFNKEGTFALDLGNNEGATPEIYIGTNNGYKKIRDRNTIWTDGVQSFSDSEKQQARTNIGITGQSDSSSNGAISINGASQTSNRFLTSLTFPELAFTYLNPLYTGTFTDPYGLKISSGSSLIDTINTLTNPGIYTVYMNRNATDVPAEAAAISSSLRGLVCLSQINKHYAYILMIDQQSNFYIQYVQGDVGSGWKKASTFSGSYTDLTDTPDIPTELQWIDF